MTTDDTNSAQLQRVQALQLPTARVVSRSAIETPRRED